MRFLVFLLAVNLFAFEGAFIKGAIKLFSKESIEEVSKKYGDDGIRALVRLKNGSYNSLEKLQSIYARYGKEGVKIVAKYGEKAVANKESFEIVKKFGDKGFYLITKFPGKSVEYYKKFGDRFVILSERFGSSRVIGYLDGAKKYYADKKVIRFLEKFGEKANEFLDRHWKKLLISGFVLLNADSLIKSSENVAKEAVDVAGKSVTVTFSKGIESLFDSTGVFIGIAFIIFIILKFGADFILKLKKK